MKKLSDKTKKTNFFLDLFNNNNVLFMIAFFFSGIFLSANYYQDQCNEYILDRFFEPAPEFAPPIALNVIEYKLNYNQTKYANVQLKNSSFVVE